MSLVIEWRTTDPSALGATLAGRLRLPRPDPGADRLAFVLDRGSLVVVRGRPGEPDRIDAVELGQAPTIPPLPGRPPGIPPLPGRQPTTSDASMGGIRLLGVGWATVDLERGSAEVAGRLGIAARRFRPAPEERWLGARARVAGTQGVALIVLEPATEGRLAAALARAGEGPVAVYVGLPGPAVDATRPGPLGPASLVHAARPWGPFVLAVPGTHDAGRARGTIGG